MPDPVLIADERAEAAVERGVPGIVLGIVIDGEPAVVRSYGKTEADSVVRVGSITKVFTAIGVAQLFERGLLDWDDPVERHLRAYSFRPAPGRRPATVREVLTHTAGFGEFRRLREMRAKTIPFVVDDGERIPPLREVYADGLRALAAPGRQYIYANHAFASLGQLVEDVSGEPYEKYIKAHILEPLGMNSSDIELTEELRARLAQGWHVTKNGPVEVPLQHITIAPAGSLYSTVDDMLRFVSWVSTGGRAVSTEVLQPSTLATMFERHFGSDPRLPGQGLGFYRNDLAGEPVVGHDGGFPGFVASFAALPARSFGAFACATTIDLASREIVDRTIEAYLGMPEATQRIPRDLPVPANRERLAGVYGPALGPGADWRAWTEYGGEFRIETTSTGLRLSTPQGPHESGVALVPGDPDDDRFWLGAGQRLGAPQLVRVKFTDLGFEGFIPQPVRLHKRTVPASRARRALFSLATMDATRRQRRVAAGVGALLTTGAALLLCRRARARTGRTARRSRPR